MKQLRPKFTDKTLQNGWVSWKYWKEQHVPFAMCSDNVETLKKSLEIWKTESVT
jgi:hypothetical protein